jgi:putative ABC transport system permease protein
METLLQDLRQAVRMLRQSPGFTAVVIAALALGVGANTAIFSVVDTVLLKPLPYAQPDRLVAVWGRALDLGYDEIGLTEGELTELQRDSKTLQAVGMYTYDGVTLSSVEDTGAKEPERVQLAALTSGVLPILRVKPALGRGFLPEEEQPGRGRVIILSDEIWRSRYGADPKIVGKNVRIQATPFEVVGVLPAGFRLPADLAGEESTDVFIPLTFNRQDPRWISHNGTSVARLRDGATVEQARAEVETLARRMRQEHAKYYPANAGLEMLTDSLHSKTAGNVRTPLLILLGAVALVLLIACANVANLLLARSEVRQKEVAVRIALGAERRHLIRQFLTESLLYGLLGGGLGLLLATWGLAALVALHPAQLPRLGDVGIDLRVLAFTFTVAVVASIASGLFPALQVSRENLSPLLKEEGRGSSAGIRGQLFRRTLVVAEVALAVVLVIGSGLLIRSFVGLQKVDLGFRPEGVLTLRASLPASKYREAAGALAFYTQQAERLAGLPGVQSAAVSNVVPFDQSGWDNVFDIEGKPGALENPAAFGDAFPNANFRMVTPGYFETLGIPLQQGRAFLASDHSEATGVAVVNETLAKRFWPGQSPLGRRIRFYLDETQRGAWLSIVGVVGDVKDESARTDTKPEVYVPLAQAAFSVAGPPPRDLTLVLRTDGDPEAAAGPVSQALRQAERDVTLYRINSLESFIGDSVAQPRFNTLLITVFAALALALAMIGVYGVMSYSVARRTHEMGIRFALGAGAGDVLHLVVQQGMSLTLAGLGFGLLAALGAARLMMSLLFGVGPFDALVYVQVAAVLAAVALLACYVPARRAARVDPMVALKPY